MQQDRVPIVSNKQAGEDTYVLRLKSDRLAKETKPGQFLHVRVVDSLDPLLRRPLSLHRRYPETGEIELLYKLKGTGTHLLAQRTVKETLDVIGPLGNGFPKPKGTVYLVAGGMGVAPLAAVVDDMSAEQNKNATVFIGAKNSSALLCVDEFKALGIEVQVATEDGTAGHKGFVSDLVLALPDPDTIFCCGPNGMIRTLVGHALDKDMTCYASVEQRMACGLGVCRACAIQLTDSNGTHYGRVCADGPVFSAEQLSAWAAGDTHQDPSRR